MTAVRPVQPIHEAAPFIFEPPFSDMPLPKMLQFELQIYGTKELTGNNDNPLFLNWEGSIVAAGVQGARAWQPGMPWCGLAHAYVAVLAGKRPVDQPYWAQNWAKWGTPETKQSAALGDTLVFVRPGGGHVGTYVFETTNFFGVIGGNEGDAARIVLEPKAHCVAVRRPPMTTPPASRRKVVLADPSNPGAWSLA